VRHLWRYLALLLLCSLGWGAWFLVTHPKWGMAQSRNGPPSPAVQARALTIVGWHKRGDRVEKAWEVTAHQVSQGSDGNGQQFQEITDGTLFQDGRPVAQFRAGHGQGDQEQNVLTIEGGAHLRLLGDGTTLDTEAIHWRGPQRQLWLPRPTRITRGSLHLVAQKAHFDLQLGRLTIEALSGEDRQLTFQAPHGLMYLKDHRLELHPVTLRMPSGEASARRAVFLPSEGRFKAHEVHMKLLISSAAHAAAATGLTLALLNAAGAAPAPEKKPQEMQVKGDTLTNSEKEMVIANAVVVHRDTTVTADRMVIEKDAAGHAERIIATGKPKAVNNRDEVTGEKMTVFPKERRVLVEGNFRVVVLPKPDEAPPPSNGSVREQVKDGTMTGDRLEYDYRNKNVAAQGKLKLVSRGRTVTGDRLFYTDKTQEVEFFGPVHARDEKGQTFDTATGVKLALDKSGISHVPGKFTATLYVDEDEEPAAPSDNQKSSSSDTQKTAAAPNPPAPPEKTPPADQKSP
jgi:LPS export ABC transporter protein LptC